MDPDWAWLSTLAVALLAAGVAAGLLAGLLGVGGGIVLVPVLFHIFELLGIDEAVRMHAAVATSLATIMPTAITSARSHWRRGAVDASLLRSWGPAVLLGAVVGTAVATAVRGQVLTGVFATLALAVTANMGLRPEGSALRDGLPKGIAGRVIPVLIGILSAIMGIGGGTLSVPILSACRYPIRKAVGTAAALGLIIAVPGAIGFVVAGLNVPARPPASLGYVNAIGFAVITPATIAAAPWGARLAHSVNPAALRKAFAVFLLATSLRMIYGLMV